ncbi:MAG TPA: AAA family ATPase [Rhizomicrobium sp.]|jgi:predicted ATPase
MYISHIAIKNFRALENIDCDLSQRVNVIVGPNGVGKTTIIQAARFVKGLIAARTQSEAQQVLISLNAASPHFPQRVFLQNLARDISKPVEIRCTYVLTKEEVGILKVSTSEIVRAIVSGRAGRAFANPTELIQYLQSDLGAEAQVAATTELNSSVVKLDVDPSLVVGLTLDVKTGSFLQTDQLAGPMIGFLDQRLPPSQTMFSYFPADRALPMGEVNLQLGAPDAQQQLESHTAQPQLKYQRLKNTILRSLVIDEPGTGSIKDDFERIFSGLLREKTIETISMNELGLLSIMVRDSVTGRTIELDSLSSGEKNIALTFLLVARSVAAGGIALFDEPELHLNPAVSRDLLPFVMREYAIGRNIQFIMCTHSPEVLSGAFKDEQCTLLHLKSASDISKIGKSAINEYSEALSKLGTTFSETLFYEGTIFVEGESDIAFLEAAFPDLVKKYQLKDRGGRREVEKTVLQIQALEKKGQKLDPIFLIFDLDDEPTGLKNSRSVKILQWPKRCVENYMIDIDVLSEILRDKDLTSAPIDSAGEVHNLLRDLALQQLDALAARNVYVRRGYKGPSFFKADLALSSEGEIATALFGRMHDAQASMPPIGKDAWVMAFLAEMGSERTDLSLMWEAKWKDLCDGKKLISDLHKRQQFRLSEAALKERIVRKMRDRSSDNWQLAKALLENLLRSAKCD